MESMIETLISEITEISLHSLTVAPWNARKTYDEDALKGLTESVVKHGIQVPLIVRQTSDEHALVLMYEIVAGHRRHRAAQAAGRVSAPCIVRVLNDAEAREIGLVDNLQRENLPPMEEAEAFAEMLRSPITSIHSVAATLGIDPSYISRRLKLLDAAEPVRAALAAGAIEVGHALELARLDPKQQLTLLSRMNVIDHSTLDVDPSDDDDDNEGEDEDESFDVDDNEESEEGTDQPAAEIQWYATSMSVAALRGLIQKTTLRVLSNAPFPLDDEFPPMACSECPKRSTNSALLFADVKQDTCTDRSCFDGKVTAWITYSVEQAKEQKQPLVKLSSKSWTQEKDLVLEHSVRVLDEETPTCERQENAIWVDGTRAGHLVTICSDRECATHHGETRRENQEADKNAKANRKQTLSRMNAEKRYRKALFDAIAHAPVAESAALTTEVTRYCIQRMTSIYNNKLAEALGWNPAILQYGHAAKLEAQIDKLTPMERLRAAALSAHAGELAVQEYNLKARPTGMEALAKTLGIDVNAVRIEAVADPKKKAEVKATAQVAAKATKKATAKKPATKTAKSK
jgi:ParB family chromosome partitioning protein